MTQQQYEGRAIDWDEDYECGAGDGGFTLLAPGIYPFEVTKFERARFNGGGKIGPCPQANVVLSVTGVDMNGAMATTTIADNFKLWESLMWRTNQFFASAGFAPTGQNEKGATYSVKCWNDVVGKSGIVEIGHREYNGKEYNNILKYIAPGDVKQVGPTDQKLAQMQQSSQPVYTPQPAYAPPQPAQGVTLPAYQPQAPQAAYQAVQYGINNAKPGGF